MGFELHKRDNASQCVQLERSRLIKETGFSFRIGCISSRVIVSDHWRQMWPHHGNWKRLKDVQYVSNGQSKNLHTKEREIKNNRRQNFLQLNMEEKEEKT